MTEQTLTEALQAGSGTPESAAKHVSMADYVMETHGVENIFAYNEADGKYKYKPNVIESFGAGVGSGLKNMFGNLDDDLRIAWGEAQMAYGGYTGNEETVKRGQKLLQIANMNMQIAKERDAEYIEKEGLDPNSWSFQIGSGVANYGTMLLASYGIGGAAKAVGMTAKAADAVAGAAGLAANYGMEYQEEQREGIEQYIKKTGDKELKNITPEWARKEIGTNHAYAALSTVIEKYAGFGQQRKMFASTRNMIKGAAKTALSEGGTEGLQALVNLGIDKLDGTLLAGEEKERLYGCFREAAIGAIIGGVAGTGAAYYNRNMAVDIVAEKLNGTMNPQEAREVAKVIVDNEIKTMADVVATEVSVSTELKEKHGQIYNNMMTAINQAMDNSIKEGNQLYANMDEAERGQYVAETARLFADQTLAEATRRGVNVSDVVKESNIVYKDGRIYIEGIQNEQANDETGTILFQGQRRNVIEGFDKSEPSNAIVMDKNGNYAHGYIGEKLAKSMGVQKGAIVVYNDLLGHLPAGRIEAIQSLGYSDVLDFVDDVFNDWDAIYEGKDGSLAVVKQVDKSNTVYIKLQQEGDVYKVNTIIPSRNDFFKNKKVLAERAQSNQSLKGLPSAFSGVSNKIIPHNKKRVNTVKQKAGKINGSYNDLTKSVMLTKTANYSTLAHELGHYWLDNMYSYVKSGLASPEYLKSWNDLAGWLGISPEQINIKNSQHEKFARGYEKFLMTGVSPIQEAGTPIFKQYGKWLKKVYNTANAIPVRMNQDAIRFFKDFTEGKLPAPALTPDIVKTEKEIKAEDTAVNKIETATVNDTKEVIADREASAQNVMDTSYVEVPVENRADLNEGEAGESRVWTREMEKVQEILGEDAVFQDIANTQQYTKANLKEQAQRATEYVHNHLQEARDAIDGKIKLPENILDTALMIAYEQEMLRQGNFAEYTRVLSLHSAKSTLHGQEISAERLATQTPTTVNWWLNKALNSMRQKAERAIKRKTGQKYSEFMKAQSEKIANAIKNAKTNEEARAEVKRALEELKTTFKDAQIPEDIDTHEFFQEDTDFSIKARVMNILDDFFGVKITPEMAEIVNAKIGMIQDGFNMTMDKTGNPSIQSLKQFDSLNRYIESLTPSSNLAITTSLLRRASMLFSIKSPVLNIISNAETLFTEGLADRIGLLLTTGQMENAVDTSAILEYMKYADEAYRAAGYNISTTQNWDFEHLTKGERMLTTAGKGRFRQFARMAETGVFKYAMGYPDSFSKDLAFSGYVARRATAEAKAAKAGDVGKVATEIFKDAIKTNPETELGQRIRKEGQAYAHKTTFTDNSFLAKWAVSIRDSINDITGDLRIGDQLAPFVKTPANVANIALEYAMGGVYTLRHANRIISDLKAGQLSEVSRNAITYSVRNGIGLLLASLIAGMLDDDDYIPPSYLIGDQAQRSRIADKGGVFNAIRVGDKWISLDYFGPLSTVLAGVLCAKKEGALGFVRASGSTTINNLPIDDIMKSYDTLKEAKEDSFGMSAIKKVAADYAASYIPATVRDVAKLTDEYERDTKNDELGQIKTGIPVLRETLPTKQSVLRGGARKTEDKLLQIFFGSRVKADVQNLVAREIERLGEKGENVSVRLPSRSSQRVRALPDAKKQRIDREFAKEFYARIQKAISTSAYRNKTDEKKAELLKSIRRDITDKLYRMYK